MIIEYFDYRAGAQARGQGGRREGGKVDAGMERFYMLGLRPSTCYVRESLHAGIEIFYMLAWTESRLLLCGIFPVDMGGYAL